MTDTTTANRPTKDQATASSAHSRINIPLNMENWRHLPQEVADELTWFHQHALDEKLTFDDCSDALGYDRSTVFKVLKGTYTGNYPNITAAIKSYRKIVIDRGSIQRNEFVENRISRLIFAGLDYAMANNSTTTIEGESRTGKTTAALEWKERNNHGRSVFVRAPEIGGARGLLLEIAKAVGVNKNKSMLDIRDAIHRAFNKNRILIIDEAQNLLPKDARGNATNVEICRTIHDTTKCGLAFIATRRFSAGLEKGDYMFEQVLGRIGMPIKIKREIPWTDIQDIVRQYVTRPSKALQEACLGIANNRGRLGILVETLKVASRMAARKKAKLDEEWVFRAINVRKQMSGGN